MKFVFFTKTNWEEPPRLRHQLCKLLLRHSDAAICFFQKPRFICISRDVKDIDRRLTLFRPRELLHHKLRFFSFLSYVNSLVVGRDITQSIQVLNDDVLINFNYDYYFLRSIYPDNKIITIINDDFVNRALFGYRRPLQKALIRTCEMSDKVLVVSRALQKQIQPLVSTEVDIFYPWADQKYQNTPLSRRGRKILYWGYISKKIDFSLMGKLLSQIDGTDYSIEFVGPVAAVVKAEVEKLCSHGHFFYRDAARLDELEMDSYIASIMPYHYLPVVECTNKYFQLLARGLPTFISGMPGFIKNNSVIEIDPENYLASLDQIVNNYESYQSVISECLKGNYEESRVEQLSRYLYS